MKKTIILFLLLFTFAFISAQVIIENPEKPKSEKAGRILKFREELKITDEGGEFFFSRPNNLQIAPNGSLFVQDREQILQFDSKGKYLRNLFKHGQGPGEMQYIDNYFFTDQNIVIQNSSPHKLVFFDYEGNFIKEFRIPQHYRTLRLLSLFENLFYFHYFNLPFGEVKKPSTVDVPHIILSISIKGDNVTELKSFSLKKHIVAAPSGRSGGIYDVGEFIYVPFKNNYLFIVNTQEYSIKLYDLAENKIIREFKRKYNRVKSPPLTEEEKKSGFMIAGKRYPPPPQEYLNDIKNLFVSNNKLLVLTSSTGKDKGTLFDIFNFEGQYLDNFYIQFPDNFNPDISKTRMTISGEFLYLVEEDNEEIYRIIKYKLDDIE